MSLGKGEERGEELVSPRACRQGKKGQEASNQNVSNDETRTYNTSEAFGGIRL